MNVGFSMQVKFIYYFMSETVRKFIQKEILIAEKKKSLLETSKVKSNIQAKRSTNFTFLSRIHRYSSLLPERQML